MKPIKLIMSAFGSYADVQKIDFAKLGTVGLYLITGETGAGKTTIFDAISFALFGKASGAARDDYSMLRSDFANDKAKTFVELDFISGEDRYNIKRTIKKTGQDVSLVLPDGATLSGDRNIKPEIIEIVGLDREQFAQIVMIAQNDFLRFLQSGTDERLKILRRIFGTESFRDFQEHLKALAKQESDNRDMLLRDFLRLDVDVYKRDEKFAEWELQVKTDRAELSALEKKLLEYDRRKQELAAALAVAEELCKKFADLSECRLMLIKHEARTEGYEKSKKRAARGEISLYKIKPLDNELQKSIANHASSQADLVKARKQKAAADLELTEAEKNIESLAPLEDAKTAYEVVLREWETAEQNLNKLLTLESNHKEITRKQVVLGKKKDETITVREMLNSLPPINDYQAELDKLTAEIKSNEERLSAVLSLQKDFDAITQKQTELQKEQADFEKLNAEFQNFDKKYRELEETFLRSQAGIIAGSLVEGEPCPVCGSREHPLPAVLSDCEISEAKLTKAKDLKEKAGAKREVKASICNVFKTEIATLSNRFATDISSLIQHPEMKFVFPQDSKLHAAENLEKNLEEVFRHEYVASIETAGPILRENAGKLKSAILDGAGKKELSEKSLGDLKKSLDKFTKKLDELTPQVATLQGEISSLTKRFVEDFSIYAPTATWESSAAQLAELVGQTQKQVEVLAANKEKTKKSLDTLTANWDAAVKRKAKAESGVQSAITLVNERTANEEKTIKQQSDALTKYESALSDHGFVDEAEYKSSLLTENELATLKKQLSDYEKNGEQLARDINRLEKETEGKIQPDIVRLRADSEAAGMEATQVNEKRDEINGRLGKMESSMKELRQISALYEKSEKTYATVKQLADTANGKLDFETYAQLFYFERVLGAANQRLKIMSQNRYNLLRKTGGSDGRKRSGLEMEIMDSYTGKTRSTNSLSGGESFMASLSLALGLSDVVAQNAGGVRLDAMFIDEGFGTLDVDVLELAIRTLTEMAGANRIIGIISHVTELRERIEKQVQVEKTSSGSRIYLY